MIFWRSVILLALFSLLVLVVPVSTEAKATPTPVPSPKAISSYELFWPIAPGRVMGDSLYQLKLFKESLREFFIFGDFKKAEYNINLSEKRLVEAEYLFVVKKDYDNAGKSLETARLKMEKALGLIEKSEKSPNISILKNKFGVSLEKQRLLLNSLVSKVPEDQKKVIGEYEDYLSSLLPSPQ